MHPITEGVGVELKIEGNVPAGVETGSVKVDADHRVVVNFVPPESPAAQAGLKAGDTILSVSKSTNEQAGDDELARSMVGVTGLTLDEISDMIRGPAKSRVRVQIGRGDAHGSVLDFVMSRGYVYWPAIRRADDLGDGTFYMSLATFEPDFLMSELWTVAGKLIHTDGVKRFVLDLRDDRGGQLENAKTVLQSFMVEGPLFNVQERKGSKNKDQSIVLTRDRLVTTDEDSNIVVSVERQPMVFDPRVPLIILVNGDSASASEIVAAGLKRNRHSVVIVGEPSHGKGEGQDVVFLPGGCILEVVNFSFQPGGEDVDWAGVQLDFEIKNAGTPGDLATDIALQTGIAAADQLAAKEQSWQKRRSDLTQERKTEWAAKQKQRGN
jgi:carboxyl-terminal processing protease